MFLLTPSSSPKRDRLRTGKVPREYMPGLGGLVVHQTLVSPGALLEAEWVVVRCVHVDIHKYPMGPVEINYVGTTHRLKAVVSSSLMHPLNFGTDWIEFSRLMGQCECGQ